MSNITQNQTITDSQNNAWVESGAMVYVALTVASLSAVIMCCVWFFKHRLVRNRYGSVSTTTPEHIELNSTHLNSDEEEDIPLTDSESKTTVLVKEYKDAFTLDDPSSSESDVGDEVEESDVGGEVEESDVITAV